MLSRFQGYCSKLLAISLQVYGWGRGEHGRLGFGDNDKSSKMVPQRVHLLAGEDIVQVRQFILCQELSMD